MLHGIDETGFASGFQSRSIRPGRHRIVLEQTMTLAGLRVAIKCDGNELLAVDEGDESNDTSAQTYGNEFSLSEQVSADKPLILLRRRFGRDFVFPVGPCEGILIRIELVPKPSANP
jgi:hypothetical protein